MRVALVQETVDLRRGGAETSTCEMAAAIAALGHDVTLVCRAEDGAAAPEGAFAVHAVETVARARWRRTLEFVRAADDFCRRGGFEIVHAITPCLSANVYQPRGGTYVETIARNIALERSLLRRVVKWVDRRINWRQRLLVLLERDMLTDRRGPVVAAVSDYVRRQVLAAFGLPDERVRVVFNGVDIAPLTGAEAAAARTAWRQRLSIADGVPLALFVGHNFKLKGLRELLAAWPRVTGPAAPVLVVAGGGDARAYERQARRGGVAERVRLAGAVADMRTLYAAADVLVHPTWYDPCSRVVLEALGCGVPVVTTVFNGAAEWVEPGVHGVVVETPADADRLAAAVTACLRPALKAACVAAAGAFRERASMGRHARELVELYATVRRGIHH
jgi:UDP-glucose:(heptosyl)LPS alpha-1,3-glucosyltransferase